MAQFKLTNALNINIKDVDESTTVTLMKVACEHEEGEDEEHQQHKSKKPRLPMDFSSELLIAHPANRSNFIEYGKFIENVNEHEEIVSHHPYPPFSHLNYLGIPCSMARKRMSSRLSRT